MKDKPLGKPRGFCYYEIMKTVFLFLSNRAYTSDLLNTDYIKYLSQKYRVIVFLPKYSERSSEISNYYKNENIEYIEIPYPKGKFWTLFDVLLRNELIRKFNDNPAVQWRNKRDNDPRRWFLRKISFLFSKKIFTPDFFTFTEKFFVPNYELFKKYAKKYNPFFVLTCTPGILPFDAYAILCAKKSRIPTVAVNFSWDNLTVYPRHVRKTDYLITWNNQVKEDAIKYHNYKEENVFISGIIRFDFYFKKIENSPLREDFLKSKNLNPDYKTVLFVSKTHGSFYKDFINSFIDWQKQDDFFKKLNFFIRIAPIDQIEDYKEFFDRPNIHLEYGGKIKQNDPVFRSGAKIEMDEEDLLNTKNTLKYSDICVSLFSTMSLEAFIFDKPVINIGFIPKIKDVASFYHYKPIIEKGAVKLAKNMEELKQYIKIYLDNPEIDKESRKKIVETMVEPTDGFSYKRNVDFIEKL